MTDKTQTPRTDAAHFKYGLSVDFMAFVKGLELELSAAESRLVTMERELALFHKYNPHKATSLIRMMRDLDRIVETCEETCVEWLLEQGHTTAQLKNHGLLLRIRALAPEQNAASAAKAS